MPTVAKVSPRKYLLSAAVWAARTAERLNGGAIDSINRDRSHQRTGLALQYFTWRKALNLARIEVALRFGRTKVRAMPYEWEIDTTNICQLQCPLCNTGLGNINREQGVMHYDVFTKTVDQIKDSCIWLTLYSWGEPFLNPLIHEFVAYAHKQGIATIISSNLNRPLTEEMAEDIIKSGLDVMIISLDGVTQEVYEQYRVNGHLFRVFDNIELLVRKKRELGMQTPFLEWQFIVMRQNEHQIPAAREKAKEIGVDNIIFKKVDFPHGADDPELGERWLPQSPEYLRAKPFSKPFREDAKRCWRLWRSAIVNWDGGLAPCCYLTDKAHDFGDVTKNSVKQIWNNDHYLTARRLFEDDFTPEIAVGCGTCPVYLDSNAGQRRGPVEIKLEPVETRRITLPTNGNLSAHEVKISSNGADTVGGGSGGADSEQVSSSVTSVSEPPAKS